jgi:hypothetical protein
VIVWPEDALNFGIQISSKFLTAVEPDPAIVAACAGEATPAAKIIALEIAITLLATLRVFSILIYFLSRNGRIPKSKNNFLI